MMREIGEVLPVIRQLHERIRAAVVERCEQAAMEKMAAVALEEEGDTIYAVDRVSEEVLIAFFAERAAALG